MEKSGFNFWPWLPLLVIGCAVIANGAMIMLANKVKPEKVEEHPYVASSRIDAEKAASAAFIERGYALQTTAANPTSLQLVLTGNTNALSGTTVHLYRPDSAAADRQLSWDTPTQPLSIPVKRAGMWRIRLEAQTTDKVALLTEQAIDTTIAGTP